MDHIGVLKRAWKITWRYRVLWVFGVILALTTSRGGWGGGPQYNFGSQDVSSLRGGFDLPYALSPGIWAQLVGVLVSVGIALACFILILVILFIIARYVAETALIRLVDDREETGENRSVGQGFRMGWSRSAFRLFLIDLLIGLPLAVVFILLFLLALAPLLLWATENRAAGVAGTVVTIGLFVLFVLLAIAVGVVMSLLKRFFHRACVLEDLGVVEAIKYGFGIVRDNLADVVVMWLIMFLVGIGLALVMIVVALLLILVALVLAGLPALLAGWLSSLAFEGPVPWIAGAAVGIPLFIMVMVIPMLFLGGLVEVFNSSVWTLTYREARGSGG